MTRFLKILLGSSIFILLLIATLWLSLDLYIRGHKEELLKELTTQLNGSIPGKLIIEDMEPALIRGFPGITIALKNVTLRDSMWPEHKHDLLNARHVFMSINPFSILRDSPQITDINIIDGSIYLFADSTGNINLDLFHKPERNNGVKLKGELGNLLFENIHFIFENKFRLKHFDLDIKKLALAIHHNELGWVASADLDLFVKQLMFNVSRGSFLKNKNVKSNLSLVFSRNTSVLSIPSQIITIADNHLKVAAKFFLGRFPKEFTLDIQSDNVNYAKVTSLLTPDISSRLAVANLEKQIAFNAVVTGSMKYRDTPLVKVMLHVKDNTLKIPGAAIKQCSFECSFTNEADSLKGHNDHNSLVTIHHLQGKWSGLPFTVDTIQLLDLKNPVLAGKFISHFPLPMLNGLIGKKAFRFTAGMVGVNVSYKGGMNDQDTAHSVSGVAQIWNAEITYVPRGISFNNCNMTFTFSGNDVYLQNVKLHSGKNTLFVEGNLKNFTNLFYIAPGNISLNCKISSLLIDVDDLAAHMTKRKNENEVDDSTRYARINRLSKQMDKVLDLGSVNIGLNVDKLVYRKFTARAISADIFMDKTKVELKNVKVAHAGGNLLLNATINQQTNINKLRLAVNASNVNVREFFQSFENFGQKQLTDRNLRGVIDVKANLNGSINDSGMVVPETINGTVSFNLKQATLIDFEPLEKIGKFIFRSRDLSHVQFRNLKNTFELKADKVFISPMHVESDAIIVNVKGVYGINKGTDIDIDVPLRNPKRDELIENDSLRAERSMKGFIMHFKAAEDNDGNVKIKMVGLKHKARKPRHDWGKIGRRKKWWRRNLHEETVENK